MNLDQIKALIKQQESQTLELKKSASQLHPAFKTGCGFLNALGGIVLIGVTDSGRIVGQDVSDNTKREIAHEITKIEPSASIEVNYVEVENNKFVIVIRVDKGMHAPYTYDARPYQRDESNTTRMSQHRYEQLLVRRGQQNHSWELSIADGYSVDDLDHNEIHLAVKQGIAAGRVPAEAANESIESILKSWNDLSTLFRTHFQRAA